MRKGDKLTLSVYSLGAHSGTHIDAPMHFVATGVPIDQVPLDPLIGAARVIDIPDSVRAIDAGELNKHDWRGAQRVRSEEHTSELQSHSDLVCRLLLEKKNKERTPGT